MVNQILGMLAQRYTDQRGPGPNPFSDYLGMHEHRGGLEGGRFGDYALDQQGENYLPPDLALQVNTSGSSGPNYDCIDGNLKR